MSDTRENRIIIADMVKDVVAFYFGPAAIAKPDWMTAFEASRSDLTFGSWEQVFRSVRRGLWRPGEVSDSRATIVDGGQRRADDQEFSDGGLLALTVQVVLDIADNFDRDGALDVWIPRIQSIARYLHLIQGTDANIQTINFIEDRPFEVAVGEGRSTMHWFIEFEVVYAEFAP